MQREAKICEKKMTMAPPSPETHDTRKNTTTEDHLILQRKLKAAVRKRQWHAQKQQCPLKHQSFNEKNRARKSKYDEKKRIMRDEMTEEELTKDRKRVAEAKREQRHKKLIAFFGWDDEKRRDNEQDKSPSSCLVGYSKQGSI